MEKIAKPVTEKVDDGSLLNGKGMAKHVWERVNYKWICKTCMSDTKTSVLPEKRLRESCKGSLASCAASGSDLGHSVKEFHCRGEPLYVCAGCGGTNSRNDSGKL